MPDGLRFETGGWLHREVYDYHGEVDLAESVVFALCRDRATEWLTQQGRTLVFNDSEQPTDCPWSVHCDMETRGDRIEYDFYYGWHPTRDEALRAAVFAVLRSR